MGHGCLSHFSHFDQVSRGKAVNLRFFSEKVFGVWVDGRITNRTKTHVSINAYFNGVSWVERKPIGTEFYYPSGHAQAGETFRLTN
jgi:hypothetical protein